MRQSSLHRLQHHQIARRVTHAVVMMVSSFLLAAAALGGVPDPEQQIKNLLNPGVAGSWGTVLNEWQGGYGDQGGTSPHQNRHAHAIAMDNFYNRAANYPGKNDATLLPTVSDGVWRAGPIALNCNLPVAKTIANYFKCKFLHRKPLLLPVIEHNVEFLGTNVHGHHFASNQGLYTFLLYADENENDILDDNNVPFPQVVFARFTFVYKKMVDGPWLPGNTKIIQHHSSKEPGLPAPPGREQNIKDLLRIDKPGSWGWTLNKANVTGADMDALYANDAELLPTVKKGVWKKTCGEHGGARIKKYFDDAFLPQGPELISIDHQKVFFSPDLTLAVNQGLYTFRLNNVILPDPYPANTKKHVKARFTFVYRKGARDDWSDSKIILHHSSAVPSCPGDLTGGPNGVPDGIVDWNDMLEFLRNWGACPVIAPEPCNNNFDDDVRFDGVWKE